MRVNSVDVWMGVAAGNEKPERLEGHGVGISQGYLDHKTQPHPRTLRQAYAYGPMVVLWGRALLMSEVPLHTQRASLLNL